jgi:3-hydroxybutyryl-CoA dehydrogenase
VVGSGAMGRGIAQVTASSGLRTRLNDVDQAQLKSAEHAIDHDLDVGVRRGKLDPAAKARALANLELTSDLATAAADADVVIEAVTEDLGVKAAVFAELDARAPEGCVLATNTSALSVTELAATTRRPDRVVGLHFFNPVPRMALVEIIRGLETAEEVINWSTDFVRKLGKEPVVVNEYPGFAVSRINAMIGNEAFYMLMEGVATARDIDTAMKLGLNHPMGPFELGDLVGWDVRLKVLEHLHRTLGDKFRPCPLLLKYVASGRLGRKSGRGVFDYPATSEAAASR